MKVVVLGALALDHYILCEEFPAEDMLVFAGKRFYAPGGSGANIAINLASQGVDSVLFCGTGTDERGERLLKYLQHNGVSAVADVQEGDSAETLVMLDAQGKRRMISFGGNALYNSDAAREEQAAAVCIVDSFPEQAEKFAALYHDKLRVYVPGGCGLYFGTDSIRKVAAAVDVTVLSEPESEAVGSGFETLSPVVIVTCGAAATKLYRNGVCTVVPVQKADSGIVDTTGAGDAFASGFMAALLANADYEEAVLAGHATACRVLMKYGANLGQEEK